ncbi:helix-turn-helix domain-containing protein [Pseudooceanicola sp.]|uniref:helix-turn-helix domain-containing protein n=1 Tax=Pseudooceanicola sp. TaxID=1914328 RepID=UPI0035C6CB6F
MSIGDLIKAATKAGWLVDTTSGGEVVLSCSCPGCPGRKRLPVDNLGPVPSPCDLEHIAGAAPHVWAQYETLVGEFRRRRRQLGLDQGDVANAMGVADGYVGKLEAMHRIPRPDLVWIWAETLGLGIVLEPTELPEATREILRRKSEG